MRIMVFSLIENGLNPTVHAGSHMLVRFRRIALYSFVKKLIGN